MMCTGKGKATAKITLMHPETNGTSWHMEQQILPHLSKAVNNYLTN